MGIRNSRSNSAVVRRVNPAFDPDPVGEAAELARVFARVQARFRGEVDLEDSLRISYETARRLVLEGHPLDAAYVFRACESRHRDHLRRERREARRTIPFPPDFDPPQEHDYADVDVALDLDGAVRSAGISSMDEAICRARIRDGWSFAEIGRAHGLHREQIRRRFHAAADRLASYLRGYNDAERSRRRLTRP